MSEERFDRREFLNRARNALGAAAAASMLPKDLLAQDEVKPHGKLQDLTSFAVFEGQPKSLNLTPAAKTALRNADLVIVAGDEWTPQILKQVGESYKARRVTVDANMTPDALVAKAEAEKKAGFNAIYIDGADAMIAAGKGDDFVTAVKTLKEKSDIAVVVSRGLDRLKDIGEVADAVVLSNLYIDAAGKKQPQDVIDSYTKVKTDEAKASGTKVLALDASPDDALRKEAAGYWKDKGVVAYTPPDLGNQKVDADQVKSIDGRTK